MSRADRDLCKVERCHHGGLDYAELAALGIQPDDVLDFSVSCNPFGPPPEAVRAAAASRIDRYPDRDCLKLRRAISERIGVDVDRIVAGAGSTELLRCIALAFFRPGDPVLVVNPTYGEYVAAIRLAGAKPVELTLAEEDGFRFDAGAVAGRLRRSRARGIFLCNPNNPTGEYLPRSIVESVLREFPDCLLVLDEAYISFVDDAWDSPGLVGAANLVIVRSLTKDQALAGLRLGYAVATPDTASVLSATVPPWSVSSPAQEAGVAALGNGPYVALCKGRLARAKAFLVGQLEKLGYSALPSAANFLLLKVGDAASFRSRLLERRILVRDCASFGLAGYVRIGVRTLPECRKLAEAVNSLSFDGRGQEKVN